MLFEKWSNSLNEAGVSLALAVLLPLPLLLILPLVSLDVVLPVLLPLLGLIHHLSPLTLQFVCGELPTLIRPNTTCRVWVTSQESSSTQPSSYFCDFLLGHVVFLSVVALFWRCGSFLLPVLSVWGGRVGVTLLVIPVRRPWAASLLASSVVWGSRGLMLSASRELKKSRCKYLEQNSSTLPKSRLIIQPKGRQLIGCSQTWRP